MGLTKDEERSAIEQVYGSNMPPDTRPAEAPDFLVWEGGAVVAGVEVTEYFDSQTDARLRNIDGYALEILDTDCYRHKDDPIVAPVVDAIYTSSATGESKPVRGVMRRSPRLADRFARLATLIDEKSRKCREYLSKAPLVELVVSDPESAFTFDVFTRFYAGLEASPARQSLLSTPFQEVYLLTEQEWGKKVYVPLKTNLFAAELFVCQRAFKAARAAAACPETTSSFGVALATHLVQRGLGSVRHRVVDGAMRLAYANVEWTFGRTGMNIVVRNLGTRAPADGHSMDELGAMMDQGERELAQRVLAFAPKGLVGCCSIVLDTWRKAD